MDHPEDLSPRIVCRSCGFATCHHPFVKPGSSALGFLCDRCGTMVPPER